MPKIKAPTTEPLTTEAPKVDMSPLIADLVSGLANREEAEGSLNSATLDIVTNIHAFRDKNPECERSEIRLAIQTAVSEKTGLKLSQVTNRPGKDEKIKAEVRTQRESAYVLVSTLLSMSWPKDEKQDTKVKKLLEDGEDRFTVIKAAATKPNSRTASGNGATSSITRENLTEKFAKFVTKVETDLPAPTSEVLDLLYAAIETMQTALNAPKD